jgi:hypothetical protein
VHIPVHFMDRLCGQCSWLQIQRSGFDSWRYQNLWEIGSLERSPLSLVSTTEELLERRSSVSGLERRKYSRRDPSRWPRGNLYPRKLTLTSPTSGGRSVGTVRSRTKATEFFQTSEETFLLLHQSIGCLHLLSLCNFVQCFSNFKLTHIYYKD